MEAVNSYTMKGVNFKNPSGEGGGDVCDDKASNGSAKNCDSYWDRETFANEDDQQVPSLPIADDY